MPEEETISCRRCGRALSRPVRRVAERPQPQPEADDTSSFLPTMPVGTWAVATTPLFFDVAGEPTTTLGCLVIDPADALGLEPHPDGIRSSGCCGHDGCDGPNRRCAGCHADVATLSDDCWTVVELRFEPDAVTVVPAGTDAP